ncbi:MAG: hypothetical protein HQ525_08825, partial [Anaerolineae bacterium]|nr:hypothetical protein [Anaerolineae bacterium]
MPTANDKFYLEQLLETHSPAFAIEEVSDIVNKLYDLTGNLSLLESERDQNFCIITESGDQFIIKIANSAEDPAIIDMQIKT